MLSNCYVRIFKNSRKNFKIHKSNLIQDFKINLHRIEQVDSTGTVRYINFFLNERTIRIVAVRYQEPKRTYVRYISILFNR